MENITVIGKVKRGANTAVPNAQVRIYSTGYEGTGVSDASGNYRIENVPVGQHQITATHENVGFPMYPKALQLSAESPQTVTVNISGIVL